MNRTRALFRRIFSSETSDLKATALRSRRQSVRDAIGKGNDARDAGDWAGAAVHYAAALELDGHVAGIRVQMGHALKEAGRLAEAETAYRQAVEADPDDTDAHMQLGHVLKVQGRIDAAMEAYLAAFERDPDLTEARAEIIAAGGRDLLPGAAFGRSAVAARLSRLSASLDRTLDELRELAAVSAYPVKAYDAFRRQYPIQPPPGHAVGSQITVVVDARHAAPSGLRATLTSLLDQRASEWTALVLTGADTAAHPVGSFSYIDDRIRFADASDAARALTEADQTAVLLDAGTVLDREALGWLAFGLQRTAAAAAYADHDHFEVDWRTGAIHSEPALQSLFDPIDMAGSPRPPAVLAVASSLGPVVLEGLHMQLSGVERRRRLLLAAGRSGSVAHVPRLLASVPLDQADTVRPGVAEPGPPTLTDARILVVIPTRDEPAMLDRCIATLLGQAARPETIDVMVLDNRSVQPETASLIARLTQGGNVQCLPLDEPFNWARFNNLAVEGRDQEIVVFANNDMEMLTPQWDARLRAWLSEPTIGVVGARLLYPDRTVQHAGILLGGWQGRPSHDGLGVDANEPGPLDRWTRSRQAAAVTGAFMACRRSTFERLGGFDPLLAVAYNDIDLCLRARAMDLSVIYAADIELIHFESKTRGRDDIPEKVAWDDSELLAMHRRWGEALLFDPGVNPQWVGAVNRPFDGYRDLSLRQVLKHLDASSRPRTWSIPPTTGGRDPV